MKNTADKVALTKLKKSEEKARLESENHMKSESKQAPTTRHKERSGRDEGKGK